MLISLSFCLFILSIDILFLVIISQRYHSVTIKSIFEIISTSFIYFEFCKKIFELKLNLLFNFFRLFLEVSTILLFISLP